MRFYSKTFDRSTVQKSIHPIYGRANRPIKIKGPTRVAQPGRGGAGLPGSLFCAVFAHSFQVRWFQRGDGGVMELPLGLSYTERR